MEVKRETKNFSKSFIHPNYTKPEVKTVASEFIYNFMGKENLDKGFTITTEDGKVFKVRRATKNDFIELDVDYKYASKNSWLISYEDGNTVV